MQVLDDYPNGSARGGACYLCNAGRRDLRDPDGTLRREVVVDTGISIDFEGYLMVCESCAVEVGRQVGMVRGGDALVLVDEGRRLVVEAERERDEAIEQRQEARALAAEAKEAAHWMVCQLAESDQAAALAAIAPTPRNGQRQKASASK